MSSSVFTEGPIIPRNNESHLLCSDTEVTKESTNLVVVYGKNGINVDKKGLECLMDERKLSTISVVRLSSPTPSQKDENKKSKGGKTDGADDLLSVLEYSSERENDDRELVGLTVEEFYSPEEAKKLAKEILNYAGISNPLQINTDIEFQRFVIQNDHCYTPLTSPSQVKVEKTTLQTKCTTTSSAVASTIKTETSSSTSPRSSSNRSLNKGSILKKGNINNSEKQSAAAVAATASASTSTSASVSGSETSKTDGKESEVEEEEEYSEYTESSYSSESDNDRDSDLDFDVNDRGRRKKASAKKKGKLIGRKVTKRRQTSSTDKGDYKEQDEEKQIPVFKANRPSIESRRKSSSTGTVAPTALNNSPNSSATSKTPLKVYSGSRNQTKSIHIISQHPTPESVEIKKEPEEQQQQTKSDSISTSTTVADSNRSLLRTSNIPPKRKSEGVFTEISAFLTQSGESSKPNLKVTQLKLESPQTATKGFMPLGIEAAAKNQLPAQISIQTHQSSTELAAENDKQLDLIDSIVKDEMKKSSVIVKDTMNEDIPHLVKMLESTEKAVLAKSKALPSSSAGNTNSSSSTYTHPVEDIDITNAPLLETPEDDIPEDLLQHVVELMENKNIQHVIDKEILTNETTTTVTATAAATAESMQQAMKTISQQDSFNESLNASNNFSNIDLKNPIKKEPIEIVRKDGRVIKLPPIEAPTTRAKRRAQTQGTTSTPTTLKDLSSNPISTTTAATRTAQTSNSRRNSTVTSEQKTNSATKKRGSISSASAQSTPKEKEESTEDEESDSEDDPNKLWCICRQPHNNRFMICCDVCEDWFHGTCVNITKAMGLEMELKGVEWRCPNCMKKEDPETKKSIQTRINELSSKKYELNAIQQEQQEQFDETKKTNDTTKKQVSQSQAVTAAVAAASGSGVKKFEQTKKTELNRRKSVNESILKKSTNDSTKLSLSSSSSSSTDQTQKNLSDIFKTIESTMMTTTTPTTTQRKLTFVTLSPASLESKPVVETAQKGQGQMKHVQKKNPDNGRQPKDEKQKKIQQQQQDSSFNESDVSGSESSRASSKPSKVIVKQSIKVDSSSKTSTDALLLNCVVCKKPVRPNSIYCSDDCIRRHANNSRIIVSKASKAAAAASSPSEEDKKKKTPSSFEEALAKASEPTLQMKNKIERVCVFERKSGRILTGSSAPTTANLKKWLHDNPTFEVVQPGSPQALVIERSKQKQKLAISTPTSEKMITVIRSTVTTPINDKIITVVRSNVTTPTTLTTPSTSTMISPTLISSVKGRTTLQIEMQPLSSSTPKIKKIIQMTTVTKSTPTTTGMEPKLNQIKADSFENRKAKDDREMMKESLKDKKEDKDKEKEKEMKNVKMIKKQSSVEQTKESSSNPSTPTNDTEPIRLMVRKTLKEQLMNRMSEVKDSEAPRLTEQEIEEFANETENEMYKLFNSDVGIKYKTKYRSLMFNIKDRKNETLFQKICGRVIEPKRLVRMSPDEMASQELAQWRQNENKHQLEMIKKSELDLLSCKKNYVLKTHKGEEVIESKSTDQVSLDITIPVEDVVTVLNNSAVSSTSELTGPISPYDKGKDNYKVSSSHESSSHDVGTTNQMVGQEGGGKEKTSDDKKKVHSSSSGSSSRDREHRDRHHRQKEKHRHKKRSRSRSRSRDRKHRSPGREDKRSRSEKDRSSETRKEKGEMKERSSSSKDRHESSQKDKEKSQTMTTMFKQSTKQSSLSSSSQAITKLKDKDVKPNKGGNKSDSEYNLIDKILESTKTVEQAANLIATGEDAKDKEKDKEKQVTKTSSSHPSAPASASSTKSKFSELNTNSTDSDQEPSSTVTIATPPEDQYVKYSGDIGSIIWSGSINMIDVATFQIIIQPVCGMCNELDKDLPLELDVVGRISPETVWEYIVKIKKSPNKEIVIVRLVPACESENLAYTSLYTYLDKRKRLGVVKTTSPHLKDFYILPLGSQKILPQVLQSTMSKSSDFYDDDSRPDLLMGIVIRIMGKRPSIPSAIAATVPRSFHPPAKIRKTADTSVIPNHISTTLDEDNFTPPSSPKRKLESSKSILTAGRLPPKTTATDSVDIDAMIPPVKLTKSYEQDDEPYSPGGSSDDDNLGMGSLPSASSSSAIDTTTPDDLKRKMDEINRQIEAQKMEIAGMLNMDQSKSYSSTLPSVDLTPALANISIPSNLQQILASIKQTPPPSLSSTSFSSSSVTDPQTAPIPSPPRISSSNMAPSVPPVTSTSFSSTVSGASGNVPPPPLIGSLLNTSSSDEEYVPGSISTKISATEEEERSSDVAASEDKSSTTAPDLTPSNSSGVTAESFTHDIDLRVEYPQLSKKPRWNQISNPPPPGLEDEYS